MKKKIFSILLIVVLMMSMLVGLTACGDDEEDDDTSSSKSSSRRKSDSSSVEVTAQDISGNPSYYYGKTVDYSANGVNDWKIFYSNGTNIFLIASDYVPNKNIPLKKAGLTKYNDYNVYWEEEPEIGDSLSHLKLFMGEGYTEADEDESTHFAYSLLNTDNWTDFVNEEEGATYAIGSPTIEMWIESWNDVYPDEQKNYYTSKYGYTFDNPLYEYLTDIEETEGYQNSLYYPHPEKDPDDSDGWKQSYGYWLSSPGFSGLLNVASNGTVSGMGSNNVRVKLYSIRPVICLDSKIGLSAGVGNFDYSIVK